MIIFKYIHKFLNVNSKNYKSNLQKALNNNWILEYESKNIIKCRTHLKKINPLWNK